MDRLKRLSLLAACSIYAVSVGSATAQSTRSPVDQWQTIIADAAQQFGIPDAWIRSVMRAESGGRTHFNGKPITSPKGAMGLMQIMPDTYRGLRIQYGLGSDAYDPHDNIFAGAAYLRQMYDRYGYPSLFAAYNAGPKRLDDFLLHGNGLPRATVDYVDDVAPGSGVAFAVPSKRNGLPLPMPSTGANPPSQDSLFFDRRDVNSVSNPAPSVANSSHFAATNSAAVFVPLSTETH